MTRRKLTIELRQKIRAYWKTHTTAMTAAKFNVSVSSVRKAVNEPINYIAIPGRK